MFDSHGNFATEAFQEQAKRVRNSQSVILKGQELDRLESYFKYLAQTKDPHGPAMVELWASGLFEEVINILSTPLSQDLNIADRYLELATNAGNGKLLDSESSWNLLTHLITVRSLRTRLLREDEAHVAAFETLWNEMSSLPADRYWADEVARVILISMAHIIAVTESPLKSKLIIDLIQHDSILLFGRALFTSTDILPWIDQIRGVTDDLSTYRELRSLGPLEKAQLHWVHVWRCLNSSQRSITADELRPSREVANKFWIRFGLEALGINLERFGECLPDTADIQACGRIKCPRMLQGDVPDSNFGCYRFDANQ
ncbi:hypothetical protein FRC01_008143 [Tulasnella sp. 417]|nr:hypothetical protein FRC01_008143 [Tulasnella sp. 417]